ncbi:HEAT repeat domain-containing protein [Dietzia sp. B32]|uniref:HEAT repeat domain-containing protein n=1 Tax=Dietzia sp. B32 TaxID=2915130 RepID=UPI0021AD5564|nr:HEAT repeat domain-containing protein [Dietzia sp. B32]UVE94640.1 HEAT repeat domain-containing protein [Dietzia sp. B32]
MLPSYDDPSPSLLDDVAPEVASGVLTTSLWVLVATIGILVVVMFWAHAARVSRGRRVERILRPIRPRLLALAADEEPDDEPPGRLGRYRARVVDRAVLDLLGKVRGGAVTALVDILDGHGTVDGALRGVRSLSATTRARSAQVLGATRRPEHAAPLAGLLRDRDRAVRSTAVRALGVLGDATYADAVLRAVREDGGISGVPSYVAADALLAMGDDVREAVRRGLDDPDPGVRYVAATVAARGGMASLLPRLLHLFRTDRDERVRAAAARTLGMIGDARVIDDLGRALGAHEPAAVRLATATALGELGAPAAIPPLRTVLADPDRRLAEVAAGALASLGRRGEAVLVDALERGTIPPEISVRDTSMVSEDDLAALASLGAVTAIGIRERRPELYDLATSTRRAGELTRHDEEPTP